MSNPTFTTAAPDAPPPDPSKHVNYTQGMVLGVDDFQQEFAYLSNRDQWLARDAIGYGTVCGLHVALDPSDQNSLSVSPGVAINPRGQLIRVAPRQCAKLDAWMALPATTDRLNQLGIGASGIFTAYVVLCYRDCPVDNVPVPGEPCRCDSDTMAASRIMDDFRLELSLTPPPQVEEEIIREFVTWLRGIEVVDFEPGPNDLEAFLQEIREAFGCGDSPPQSPPDVFFGSPPAGLRIPRRLSCEWMRAVLKLWTTELRPCWQAQCAPQRTCGCCGPCGCHSSGAEPDEMACDCLLLAAVEITRTGGAITGATLNEDRRPYLVHLRMLQELLLCGPCCGEGCGDSRTFATVFALDQDTLQIWVHHPVALSLPEEAVTLQIGGSNISGFIISPAVSPPGLNLFDLTLSGSPMPAIGNSATIELWFDASLIHEPDGGTLAEAIWQDKYCYGDYAEPRLHVFAASGALVSLGGDVVGPPAHNSLNAIQGKPLNVAGVTNNQVLGFGGGTWHPVALPVPAIQLPSINTGAGALGNSLKYAREDHVHPTPPPPPIPQPGNIVPKADAGAGNKGSSLNYSREDHVHPAPKVTGDFVEHPPDHPRYLIVAAGIVQGDGTARSPVYDKLTATATANGTLTVKFDQYEDPAKKKLHQYIVKVLPVMPKEQEGLIGVAFGDFLPGSFTLRVTGAGGQPAPKKTLEKLEFMIEVSQFFGN